MGVDPSDEALLAGYATGDPRTAAAFVRRFQGRVYGLALTIVRQPALAEEVAQETFARVYRHAGNYDARKGRVSTWLLSIARNLAIDVTRMKRLDPVDPEVIEAEVTIDFQAPGADEGGLQPDERDQLRSAISDLPDDQRRAIVLAAYHGAHRARDQRSRRRAPGDGQDADPDRDAEASLGAGGAGLMDPRCDETRELAAELALGIVEGEERGRALQHLADCPDCRLRVEELSEVADELLLLAPHREPPVGFESRVLAQRLAQAGAQAPPPTSPGARAGGGRCGRGRDHPRDRLAATCGSPRITGRPWTRRTARNSSPTLCAAAADAHVGTVFSYEGSPSWVHIDVDPGQRAGLTAAELVTDEGSQVPLQLVPPRPAGRLGGLDPG